jgi:hypothetical protein
LFSRSQHFGGLFLVTKGILATWIVLGQANPQIGFGTDAAIWFLGMCFDRLSFAVPLNIGALEGSCILALKATGYDALLHQVKPDSRVQLLHGQKRIEC